MTRILATASALVLIAGIAQAQDVPPAPPTSPVADIVADLTEQGYTRIEIKPGRGITEIEAIRGDEKLELDVVSRSGKVVKSETEAVRPGENTTPGIYVDRDRRGRDDRRGSGQSSDDSPDGYDDSDGREGGGHGSDDGDDHDHGDDHGGDRDDDDRDDDRDDDGDDDHGDHGPGHG